MVTQLGLIFRYGTQRGKNALEQLLRVITGLLMA
nr:unnamed protein product [Callosobruchus chinensis]